MIPITIKNSESLYFPTGDIVLLSLPKDGVVTAFKVDRVFLIRSSPVFEGMFALPASEDVESYDNVPLVKLQDDSGHLTMFLKTLYDSRCIPWEKHDPNTIRMVEGILLLATKYQIDHLRERMVSLLERDWPSNLSDWDINEAEIKARKESKSIWEISFPDPCEAIRLARKCDVPSILPAAFYCLSRIRGISDRHMPGSIQQIMVDLHRERLLVPTTDFSLLSAQDLHSLIVGRDVILHIFEHCLDAALNEMTEPEHKHTTSDSNKCWRSLLKYKDKLHLRVFQDFLDPLSVMKGDDDHLSRDCWFCGMEFIELMKPKRNMLWDKLPSIFMLDTKE